MPEKVNGFTSKNSFAILPDVTAEEFTKLLEEKLMERLGDAAYLASPRKRDDREVSSDNGFHSEGDLPGISDLSSKDLDSHIVHR